MSYDTDAQAVINAMTGTAPPVWHQDAINTFVLALKAATVGASTVWALIDDFGYPAAQDSVAANLKWKTLGTITPTSSPTLTVYSSGVIGGYAGNGTTSYCATNHNPSTFGGSFTQNSGSIGVYVSAAVSNTANSTSVIGAADATSGSSIQVWSGTGNGPRTRINSASITTATVTVATRLGLTSVDRHQSTTVEQFRNGSQLESLSQTSAAIGNRALLTGAGTTTAGAATGFSTDTIAFWFVGGSLGSSGQSALYSAVDAYLTTLSAASHGASYTFAGNSVGLSTTSMSDSAKRPLAGSSTGAGAATASLIRRTALAGSSVGGSTTSAAMIRRAPIAGSSTSASGGTCQTNRRAPLVGVSAGAGGCAMATSAKRPFAGLSSGSSSTSADFIGSGTVAAGDLPERRRRR